ncbi:MAG: hypothetical protein ABEL76_11035, partial [Bradymonadaceae bacterium]
MPTSQPPNQSGRSNADGALEGDDPIWSADDLLSMIDRDDPEVRAWALRRAALQVEDDRVEAVA